MEGESGGGASYSGNTDEPRTESAGLLDPKEYVSHHRQAEDHCKDSALAVEPEAALAAEELRPADELPLVLHAEALAAHLAGWRRVAVGVLDLQPRLQAMCVDDADSAGACARTNERAARLLAVAALRLLLLLLLLLLDVRLGLRRSDLVGGLHNNNLVQRA